MKELELKIGNFEADVSLIVVVNGNMYAYNHCYW